MGFRFSKVVLHRHRRVHSRLLVWSVGGQDRAMRTMPWAGATAPYGTGPLLPQARSAKHSISTAPVLISRSVIARFYDFPTLLRLKHGFIRRAPVLIHLPAASL